MDRKTHETLEEIIIYLKKIPDRLNELSDFELQKIEKVIGFNIPSQNQFQNTVTALRKYISDKHK